MRYRSICLPSNQKITHPVESPLLPSVFTSDGIIIWYYCCIPQKEKEFLILDSEIKSPVDYLEYGEIPEKYHRICNLIRKSRCAIDDKTNDTYL